MKSISAELKSICTSKSFLGWLDILNGNKKVDSKTITVEKLLTGFCEDLAAYLLQKYGARICIFDDKDLRAGHYFVFLEGKYYDGFNHRGVDDPLKLEWSNRLLKRSNVDLIKYLRHDWDGGSFYSKYFDALDRLLMEETEESCVKLDTFKIK